jgi:predicted cupin superfamily sugar epimerase
MVTGRAAALVRELGLVEHPEGGYYGEVYRSSAAVELADRRGPRPALTTIYFLLPAGSVSRWHRVLSDEVWHFYEGTPVELWVAQPGGEDIRRVRLGPLAPGQRPVEAVPAGYWQAARSTGEYSLVGCTVGPGFDYRDFALAADCTDAPSRLRAAPDHARLW